MSENKTRKNTLRPGAKLNTTALTLAKNLVALGCSVDDLGLVMGVKGITITKWKERYPEYFEACKSGKGVLKGILLAQMIRAAQGYDYDEVDEIKKPVLEKDKESGLWKETGEYTLPEIRTHHKHQPGNPALLEFIVTNMLPEDFKRTLKVEAQDGAYKQVAEMEADIIKQIAGKLLNMLPTAPTTKVVESREIINGPIESREINSIDAKDSNRKPTV